jgi:hypothetical protein
LTDVEVGISDLLADRDCPRRAAYGARRHVGVGEQDHASQTPEHQNAAAAYGSCLHDVLQLVEEGWMDDDAIQQAWATWGNVLWPEDLTLLHEDLEAFRAQRDFQNVRTVLAEGELRAYLTTLPDGRRVFFRAKIDRLYERLNEPGHYIQVDYKTSRWEKTQEEVDKDPQQWAYNWVVHEYYPEIEDGGLEQFYDQFRGGQLRIAPKTDAQRAEIKQWLITQVGVYFSRKHDQPDGLPAPRFNQWCPWCEIIMDCQIIPKLSSWALSRIALLGAELPDDLYVTPMDEHLAPFTDSQTAIKTLKEYESRVKDLVRSLPEAERDRLGFRTYQRNNTVFTPQALEELHGALGSSFYSLVSATQKRLGAIPDDTLKQWALALGEKVPGAIVVTRKR